MYSTGTITHSTGTRQNKSCTISLHLLPLRLTTFQLFTKRGFQTTDDIDESRMQGGMANLAVELDVSIQVAAGLVREVQFCLSKSRDVVNVEGGLNLEVGNGENAVIHSAGIMTASDLILLYDQKYQRHRSDGLGNQFIVSFCRSIDGLLGGGIALGQVTEIAGLPGTGKTQLAMQLCVLARLPQIYGGVQGQALYIDAEGSFIPERVWSMASALVGHVEATAARRNRKSCNQDDGNSKGVEKTRKLAATSSPVLTTEQIMDSIQVFRVHDETALLATLYSLPHYLQEQKRKLQAKETNDSQQPSQLPVKLIIIDSIAFHFRAVTPTDSNYYYKRTKTIVNLAALLGSLASEYNVAVVAINQMTTKVGDSGRRGVPSSSSFSTKIVPALGESWAHATATRLLLSFDSLKYGFSPVGEPENEEKGYGGGDDDKDIDNERQGGTINRQDQHRICTLVKSPNRPSGTARFRILETGIRDAPPLGERNVRASSGHSDPNKRHRTH
jgi:RecA/RadA recombinase